ncbi:MAG: alanine racemase [Chloroflexota bacterium]
MASLTNLGTLPGRMALLDGINGSILIDDSYAGSHASTIDALNWLKEIRDDGQRTIFVLGDMENSGRNNRFAHRSIGQYVADIADIIVTQGLNAALTARSSVDSGKDVADVRITYSTQDTITAVKSLGITSDDIILIKGSVRAGMEDVVAGLLENPERDSSLLVRQQRRNRDENTFLRPSWIDIDVDAIANNVRIIKSHIGDVELMAVVKADAYGHGAVMVARTALANGATQLAVASIAEAIELRDAGIRAPILVMTYAPAQTVRQAHQLDITLTVYDVEQAEQYDRVARTLSGKLKVHIKIDSGMGRLGILADEAMRAFRLFNALNNLEVEGVYTHFSSAEDDPDYTAYQVETFLEAIRPLRAAGIRVKYTHAANSPGTLASTDNHFNLVRPGVMLYGLPPSEETPLYEGMRPAMSWKTSVIQVKLFPAGHPIGYGRTYVTSDEELIAFLPVGYADGFRRSPNTWEYVLIKGQRAPVVGRISMEKVAVSVTHISNVRAGDEVVLLGKQGNEEITATMIADWLGTINYEVVSNILARVPRR